ncbi:putative gamma-glutamylcyclotransferase CG2811 [Contarinia nasturtii]|uniref:putative gamma-glutamylcyclotransferase CG2811 n=1 Tax=Contarinia nasturtii TaxID=265458 RepID=UPI0012D3A604|nr:putative gamma-glutamylcyclotransferase CG2811 [Contarinia nasturtii]
MLHTEMFLIFVYGTLKINQPNHYLMLDPANGASRFIRNGTTDDKYPMVMGTRYNIPFLVDLKDVGLNINGEIYEVDEQMLARLDEFEGHPHYYLRKQIAVKSDDGKQYLCWTYLLTKYPEDFLKDRVFLASYENNAEFPYIKPSDRPSNGPKPSEDLDYRP